MKNKYFASLAFALLFLTSCGSHTESTQASLASITTLQPVDEKITDLQDEFRNVFATMLRDVKSSEDAQKAFLYVNPSDVADSNENQATENPITLSKQKMQNLTPKDLFLAAQNRSNKDESLLISKAFNVEKPITVVFFPGVVAEFSEVKGFDEFFAPESSFKKTYTPLLETLTTSMYSVRDLQTSEVPLSQVVNIGSLDNSAGKPYVKMISLLTNLGSLESIGSVENASRVFMERLDTLFANLPPEEQKDIYFLGHSRGAIAALDILSHASAEKDSHPWVHSIKGLISLSGVLYGSTLADVTSPEVSRPSAEFYHDARKLGESLQPYLSVGSFFHNSKVLSEFSLQASKHVFQMLKRSPSGFKQEILDKGISLPTPLELTNLVLNGISHTVELKHLTDIFKIDNMVRIKIMLGSLFTSTDELTTASRTKWWKTHTIPANIKYFSLNGVGADALEDSHGQSPLNDSPYYAPNSMENIFLRYLFYEVLDGGNNHLNDGAVGLQESRFWPKYSQALNPQQKYFPYYDLGSVATHHFGVAYPYIYENSNAEPNAFPRREMVKSILATVLSVK